MSLEVINVFSLLINVVTGKYLSLAFATMNFDFS